MRLRNALVVVALSVGVRNAAAQRPHAPDPSDIRLYAQILSMTDTRALDIPLVDRALASKWSALRAAATMAIGQVGAEVGSPAAARLRALLADSDSTVAADAAYSLGLLRDTASITALSEALQSERAVAREA